MRIFSQHLLAYNNFFAGDSLDVVKLIPITQCQFRFIAEYDRKLCHFAIAPANIDQVSARDFYTIQVTCVPLLRQCRQKVHLPVIEAGNCLHNSSNTTVITSIMVASALISGVTPVLNCV